LPLSIFGEGQVSIKQWANFRQARQIDGSLDQVQKKYFYERHPSFAGCVGAQIVIGVKGIYIRNMTTATQSSVKKQMNDALHIALDAAAKTSGAIGAEVKGRLETQITSSLDASDKFSSSGGHRFIPVLYRYDTVQGRKLYCSDTMQVHASPATDVEDCRRMVGDGGAAPTSSTLTGTTITWFTTTSSVSADAGKDASKAGHFVKCDCEQAPGT